VVSRLLRRILYNGSSGMANPIEYIFVVKRDKKDVED